MNEKYLPIGTVVSLQNGGKNLMIVGFNPITNDVNGPMSFDYAGCFYPEGMLSSDEAYLFNHDMIKEVCFLGFVNEDEKVFKEILNQSMKERDLERTPREENTPPVNAEYESKEKQKVEMNNKDIIPEIPKTTIEPLRNQEQTTNDSDSNIDTSIKTESEPNNKSDIFEKLRVQR